MSSAWEIKKYSVAYFGGGKQANGYSYRAIIGLHGDSGSLGGAYFHRSTATMPDTDSQSASGYVWCHYPSAALPQVLDILRNEKPTYLYWVAGRWHIGWIATGKEPVGEGEPTP